MKYKYWREFDNLFKIIGVYEWKIGLKNLFWKFGG